MPSRQYIGARYVPKFYSNSVDGSTQWENNVVYEPLTYVTLQNGHMYISKKQVPATVGTPASNVEYWLDLGSYNGFIDDLQNQIDIINDTTIPNVESEITALTKKTGNVVTPQMYGAVGDGSTDDTQAFIDALADCEGLLYIPAGTYKITESITIPDFVKIIGDSTYLTILKFVGCNGFVCSPQWGAQFECLTLSSVESGSYANAYKGITFNGSGVAPLAVNRCQVSDVAFFGWKVAIDLRYTRDCVIDNVRTQLGDIGIQLFGQSVNISINNSSLMCEQNNETPLDSHGSASIQIIDDNGTRGEGLMISNTLMARGTYGIYCTDFLSLNVVNNIIDLVSNIGIYSGAKYSTYADNWISSTGACMQIPQIGAGYNKIANNTFVNAGTDKCLKGAYLEQTIIDGNTFEANDTSITLGGTSQDVLVLNNIFKQTVLSASTIYANNTSNCKFIGNKSNTTGYVVQYASNERNITLLNSDRCVIDNYSDKPTSGTWNLGDVVIFNNVTTGYIGAICTVSGTPGTWKYFGALET